MAPIRIMLVDDNPMFLGIASAFFKECYPDELDVVGTAGGGEEAVALGWALRPEVVLIDLLMPGVSGFETIPRLSAQCPDAGIIALTFVDGQGCRQAALAAGVDDFVQKQTMTTDLLPAIRRVAEARRAK